MITVVTSILAFLISGEGKATIPVVEHLEAEHWVRLQADDDGEQSPPRVPAEGHIYVLDFWATWCAPCLGSMEDLSLLQADFAERNVRVIAITDEPLHVVVHSLTSTFGRNRSSNYERMRFDIAVDRDASIINAALPEHLRSLRPAAAIIDETGTVLWHGVPKKETIREVLKKVLQGEWNAEAFHAGAGKEAARRQIELDRIFDEQDWKAARQVFWEDADALTKIAFLHAFNYGNQLTETDPDLAVAYATRAVELTSRRDSFALHTLARSQFNMQRLDAAIQLQREAILANQASPNPDNYAGYYAATLQTYESEVAADESPSAAGP